MVARWTTFRCSCCRAIPRRSCFRGRPSAVEDEHVDLAHKNLSNLVNKECMEERKVEKVERGRGDAGLHRNRSNRPTAMAGL